jgi:hypothetical protein
MSWVHAAPAGAPRATARNSTTQDGSIALDLAEPRQLSKASRDLRVEHVHTVPPTVSKCLGNVAFLLDSKDPKDDRVGGP